MNTPCNEAGTTVMNENKSKHHKMDDAINEVERISWRLNELICLISEPVPVPPPGPAPVPGPVPVQPPQPAQLQPSLEAILKHGPDRIKKSCEESYMLIEKIHQILLDPS